MTPGVEIINNMSDYQGLRSRVSTALPENQSWREIPLRLTGNMRRYVWSFNDKTLAQDAQILIKKGENVRFILKNETMMNHPLHFHGHFFRVVNKQGDFSPLKHTVNVAPRSTTIIELDANLEEDWVFHFHNLDHTKSCTSRGVS